MIRAAIAGELDDVEYATDPVFGVAVNPEAPNLAGESAVYIEKQLRAFRSGARQHEVMSIIAKSLSDEDIGNLAAGYSAMKVSVELPKVN